LELFDAFAGPAGGGFDGAGAFSKGDGGAIVAAAIPSEGSGIGTGGLADF